MNNFAQIVSNVGVRVGDTSTAFAAIIKGYVNNRYKEIWERFNWEVINNDYYFYTARGYYLGTEEADNLITEEGAYIILEEASRVFQKDYILPDDFGKPLYCYDETNSKDLEETSFQNIERFFPQTFNQVGDPVKYAIYQKINATTKLPEKWLRLHPTPAYEIKILLPYQIFPTDMSEDTDYPVMDCDYEIEIGATAEAWRTKRQFAKAADFDRQYDDHIQHMVWNKENQPNKVVRFAPNTFNKDLLY